jgi:hypothetical protein
MDEVTFLQRTILILLFLTGVISVWCWKEYQRFKK